jgi:adenylate cyclase
LGATQQGLRRLFRRLRRGVLSGGRLGGLALLAGAALLRLGSPALLEAVQMRGFDLWQQRLPRQVGDHPVAIVDIDEASLAVLGQWPWPRTVVARLVDALTDAGVGAIGFDVVFAEPDRMTPTRIVEVLPGLDEETRSGLLRQPDSDAVLADAIRRGKVVLGQAAASEAASQGSGPRCAGRIAIVGPSAPVALLRYPGLVRNLPILEEAAKGCGLFAIEPEFDGIVRRVPLVLRIGDRAFAALSTELLRVAAGKPSYVLRLAKGGVESLAAGGMVIPTDADGLVWVHFAPHDPAMYVSAKDVLAGTIGRARLAGKLVVIGTSAIGLKDIKATPLESGVPGVEVHAQILENVLAGDFLARPQWAIGAELAALVILGLAMVGVVPRVRAQLSLAVLGVLCGIVLGGAWYFFRYEALLLDVTLPLATAGVLYSFLVYMSYAREEQQRRVIRNAFNRYLAPAVVEQLAEDPSRLKLGGEARNMTIMFCDVRGFTTLSEKYKEDPAGLTRLMNRFMTPMTEAIMVQRGYIDKYIGDCIMAFWNAPLADDRHAAHACAAALDMLSALDKLNAELQQETVAAGRPADDAPTLRIGIGLNTGECVVGNMGSEHRMNYTVLGDPVNLASRLEGISKAYGVVIVLGEETAGRAPGLAMLELDLIAVKGKTEPSRVYTLLGAAETAASAAFKRLADRHRAMLDAYRAQDWQAACGLADECADLQPALSGLYDAYRERIAYFAAHPPGADWRGVYVAQTK